MLDGEDFEARSADLLARQGLQVVERRFRSRAGEIDLIALDGDCLVFIEVRARRSRRFGGAMASVDRKKQCKIAKCAAYYLSRHPQWRSMACRFDVIAWDSDCDSREVQPHWVRGAFNT